MNEARIKMAVGGRVVIPAPYRRALGLRIGDELIVRLEDGEVRMLTPREAIKRAQDLVRRYVTERRSLSEELISERRTAAAHE